MTRKMIVERRVFLDLCDMFDDKTVDEACKKLREEVPKDRKLKFESDWDSTEVYYEILREENDYEYSLRLAEEKRDREERAKKQLKREERERKQYEQLKKKYG